MPTVRPSLRHRALNHWLSPGVLAGVRPGLWRRLRTTHGVDARYWPRAAVTGLAARESDKWAERQRQAVGDLSAVRVEAPVFVLGHYRSGTTRLHGLLARDPQFHAPTLLEATNPWTFAVAERTLRQRLRAVLPPTRVFDAVEVSPDMPMEDEFAICALSGCSHLLRYAFPRDWDALERFLTLEEASGAEVDAWRGAMLQFTRLLTRQRRKRLVLKSPPHTAKIPHLLALFPDARFVFVHRHPQDVFASMRRLIGITLPAATFHASGAPDMERAVVGTFRETMRAYLDTRTSIPDGRLVEVAYDDLTASPLATLDHVYRALGLGTPPPLAPEAPFTPAPQTVLDHALRQRLGRAWGDAFDAWGYKV